MTPWLLLGSVVGAAVAGWGGYELGRDAELADQARQDRAVAQGAAAAASAAAAAISKIGVQHVTIRQRAETVVREVPVYRECRHDARVLRDINEARTGRAEPAGDGVVPAAGAADR
jgi:hypothetical protein